MDADIIIKTLEDEQYKVEYKAMEEKKGKTLEQLNILKEQALANTDLKEKTIGVEKVKLETLIKNNYESLVAKDERLSVLDTINRSTSQLLDSDVRNIDKCVDLLVKCSTLLDEGALISDEQTHASEMNKFKEIVDTVIPVFYRALENAHEARSMKLETTSIYLKDSFGSIGRLNHDNGATIDQVISDGKKFIIEEK